MPIFRYNETPGNYYAYLIEGHGDDANNGLTPETAVATLNRLVAILDTYAGASRRHAVIVKKRIYNEGITYSRNASKPITFEFVGGCEIDGSGAAALRFLVSGDTIIYAKITGYTANILSTLAGFTYNMYSCIIKNNSGYLIATDHNGVGVRLNLYSSIIENSAMFVGTGPTFTGQFYLYAINSVFIGKISVSSAAGGTTLFNTINCIFANATLGVVNTISWFNFDYNCIYNATIKTLDFAAIQALGYNLNGISANPQFTDPANGQYTVNQSSPCLYRGEGGEHIGIGEGFYLQANILFFQQSAINNFQLTTGRLGFIDPLDNAFIETNPINIGQIITLEKAELAAILPTAAGEFTAGPVHYSHWYPAYSAASTYHKGAGVTDSAILYRSLVDDNLNNTPASSATKWERLTWQSGVSFAAGKIVQYTDDKWYKANTATSTSWVAGEWDEVVMTREWNLQVKTGRTYDECNAADWATIPYNTTPYLDSAGKGNSDDAYNPSTGAVIVFRFIAVRIDAKTIV